MIFETDSLKIEQAEEVKSQLLAALENEAPMITLDLLYVNKVDLCIIQLFLALQKSTQKKNIQLTLKNCSESFINTLSLSGCSDLLKCSHE